MWIVYNRNRNNPRPSNIHNDNWGGGKWQVPGVLDSSFNLTKESWSIDVNITVAFIPVLNRLFQYLTRQKVT